MKRLSPGYIALLSVTIIMAVVIIVGVMITLVSANGLVSALTNDHGLRAATVADSCAYEALWQIKHFTTSYVGAHTVRYDDNQTCAIVVTVDSGTQLKVDVVGQWQEQYARPIQLVVETSPFSLVSWQETD